MMLLLSITLLSLATSAQCVSLTVDGVSEEDKKEIIDHHNKLRNDIQPTATNMQKVIWDDNIAATAQSWASECTYVGHDDSSNRLPPSGYEYMTVGQNMHGIIPRGREVTIEEMGWTDAIDSWYNEVENWKYGIGSFNGGVVGHFTQVVQAETAHIGCGLANCPDGMKKYICNYLKNIRSSLRPYKNGTAASDCGEEFRDGNLCDCGGKLCRNGGTLDLKTCTCECEINSSGLECEIVTCPGEQKYSYYCVENKCEEMETPVFCPYKCGYCETPCSNKIGCYHGGTMVDFMKETCRCECLEGFYGDKCENYHCPDPPKPDLEGCDYHRKFCNHTIYTSYGNSIRRQCPGTCFCGQ